MLVLGGTGDLALHKLLPALYHLHREGRLPVDLRIVAVARNVLDRQGYLTLIEKHCRAVLGRGEFEAGTWASFSLRIDYFQMDLTQSAEFSRLGRFLSEHDCNRGRIYYLAITPELFESTVSRLASAGLIDAQARLVVENH